MVLHNAMRSDLLSGTLDEKERQMVDKSSEQKSSVQKNGGVTISIIVLLFLS